MNDKGEAVRWLIEEVGDNGLKAIYYYKSESFTTDAWIAMAFDTEESADKYVADNYKVFSIHRTKSIEHFFLN